MATWLIVIGGALLLRVALDRLGRRLWTKRK